MSGGLDALNEMYNLGFDHGANDIEPLLMDDTDYLRGWNAGVVETEQKKDKESQESH